MKLKRIKFEELSFVNPKIDYLLDCINLKIAEDRKGKTREENFKNLAKILKPYLKRFNLKYSKKQNTVYYISKDKGSFIVFMIHIVIAFDSTLDGSFYHFDTVMQTKNKETLFQFINRVKEYIDNVDFRYYAR